MFANGYGSDGQDNFTESEMYQFIRNWLTKVIGYSHSVPLKVLAKSARRCIGVFAYQRQYENTTAIVVFNTSEQATLLNAETGLPAGSQLKLLMGEGIKDDFVVNKDGRISIELPARAALVFIHKAGNTMPIETANVKINVTTSVQGNTFTKAVLLEGTVTAGVTDLKLVVDGFLERDVSFDFNADADGHWQVVLPASKFGTGEQKHTLNVYAPTKGVVSETLTFNTHVVPDNVIKISQTDRLAMIAV